MNPPNNLNIRKAFHPDALTILVVEDHTLFSKEIKHALMQHNVVFAKSVEEGRKKYDENLPNLTFLDIDLPDGTGFEILDHIMSHEPDAYVAMLTGSKVEDDVVVSHKKGARGYIIKPFTKSKVDECVASYLRFRESQINMRITEAEKHRDILILSSDMAVPPDGPE